MATVSLFQQRSAPGPGGYQILNEITAHTGIPAELFVYDTITQVFNHVATMDDFGFPVGVSAAQAAGALYYRSSSATATYPDVATAIEFAQMVKQRVNALLNVFDSAAAGFAGSETTAFPLPA
jgi:hypothetical protein